MNRILVDGQIGTPADPVTMNLAGDLIDLRGDDIYADINLRHNGANGRLAFADIGVFADPTNSNMDGDFVGSLNALSPRSNINNPSLRGWFNVGVLDGLFVYGEGINPASSTPNPGPVPDRLGVGSIASSGQIVLNADNTGAMWDTDIEFADGTLIGPNQAQPYQAPYYEALPEELGGGAIGLVPFNVHLKASSPQLNSVLNFGTPGAIAAETCPVILEHYGPVFDPGNDHNAVLIERSTDGGMSYIDQSSNFDMTVGTTGAERRRLTIVPKPGFAWQDGMYRITPNDLRCDDVTGSPSVVYDFVNSNGDDAFTFFVTTAPPTGCTLDGDVNGDGEVDTADFFAWVNAFGNSAPECDVNNDTMCDSADFFAWVNIFGACTACSGS